MAKILIVDDEKSIRVTLAEFVKNEGHAVWTAENADEAMRLFSDVAPDVVVTDIILPGRDGIALLRTIHSQSPETQVVVITGEPTVDSAAEAVRQGAFDYLAKPITRDAIQRAVASAVRTKQLADDRQRLEEENARYRAYLEQEVEQRDRALRESEERHRAVVENADEAIVVAQEGILRFANPATSKLTRYPLATLLGGSFFSLIFPDDRAMVAAQYEQRMKGGDAHPVYQFRVVRSDGTIRWAEIRAMRFAWDGRPATLGFLRDVTEEHEARRRDESRQRRVEQHSVALVRLAMQPALASGDLDTTLRTIAETTAGVLEVERVEVWLTDEGQETSRCAELFERTPRRHSRGRKSSLTIHPEYSAALRSERSIVASDAQHDPRTAEFNESHFIPLGVGALIDVAVRLGGDVVGMFSVEHVGPPRPWHDEEIDFVNSVAGLVTVAVESARRRRTELALEQSEKEYRSLFEDSPASVIVEDFSGVKRRLDDLRERGVADLGVYLDEHPEIVDECIRAIRIVDVNEAAVRLHRAASKADLINRIGDEFPAAAKGGFRDRLLAIWRGERVFDTMTVDSTLDGRHLHTAIRWSIPPGHEDTLDRVLLSKTDISSVVQGEQRLRRTLDGVIEAIGRATESRDPYTAGHQKLVTDLAVAIAEELRLEAGVVAGIRAAGLLHDVGKLAIPAEILSKPSALSPMEMELMKGHPQAGYEILRTVEFPWPISDIVLEHHERLDGAGYPRGLKGDAICIEARVLAVADVVEAMASHRPYRPALGIDAAINEILRGRGTAYDVNAVDACVRLLREGRFTFQARTR
jgi:PAS domain S-box-containing protein/putative nucleotidyltransferase with HDIG domain